MLFFGNAFWKGVHEEGKDIIVCLGLFACNGAQEANIRGAGSNSLNIAISYGFNLDTSVFQCIRT